MLPRGLHSPEFQGCGIIYFKHRVASNHATVYVSKSALKGNCLLSLNFLKFLDTACDFGSLVICALWGDSKALSVELDL